ncbi:50S ribosomal protein L25/general stress protein Ctc [Flavobacteriaceae bacterium]|nr:50S ribosomal protein L25/general stress protein Ctc [Flavobacteriaceae bacterium]MDA9972078.1 50S ribosomal protein L25/general stress protein Ctc [Flavobacteriaceae bacterium]MDB2673264.1 50S ribosomal protein L25/general stress protein Ctc [Flavobacteriaceae bacterium]MDB4186597.1 50S ribosomal protein L25/general stress protein Ctc [Flavobacteriaceae bacterium]MDB9941696.1 50S ribosomal protein L25/general stress protein Ctc [Flavobacteriaceae bacterium]
MKSITINGSKRESVGKKATKALRNAEMVPCVLYGDKEPIHFAAKELDFSKLVYTPNAHTVVIKTEEGTFDAVLQDIQFHPVTDKILHIDFYQLNEGKEISINIPVVVEGAAPGVLNSGGTLILNKRKLRVRALPKNLPDVIVADISELKLGNKLYTAQIASEDYSFLHPDNTVICQVKTSRASVKEDVVEETVTEDSAEAAE